MLRKLAARLASRHLVDHVDAHNIAVTEQARDRIARVKGTTNATYSTPCHVASEQKAFWKTTAWQTRLQASFVGYPVRERNIVGDLSPYHDQRAAGQDAFLQAGPTCQFVDTLRPDY
jgi:hypothetical protein